jgi:ABC-type Fe3+/spermidine/putrescine transport system ATPase subunit
MQGLAADQRALRIADVLALVGLTGFEHRDVARLSGGERQRVALARSLAPNPRLLMLDEPMGSLDAVLRQRLVIDLRAIIKRTGLTAIYVTHDRVEAFAVADRIAILHDGLIEQIGAPTEVYRRPETAFAAHFLGLGNVVPVVTVTGATAYTPLGSFPLTDTDAQAPAALLLHPDGIDLASSDARPPIVEGVVTATVFLGDAFAIDLRAGEIALSFKLLARDREPPRAGESIRITVAPDCILPLVK